VWLETLDEVLVNRLGGTADQLRGLQPTKGNGRQPLVQNAAPLETDRKLAARRFRPLLN